jgi:hypothetical protein
MPGPGRTEGGYICETNDEVDMLGGDGGFEERNEKCFIWEEEG